MGQSVVYDAGCTLRCDDPGDCVDHSRASVCGALPDLGQWGHRTFLNGGGAWDTVPHVCRFCARFDSKSGDLGLGVRQVWQNTCPCRGAFVLYRAFRCDLLVPAFFRCDACRRIVPDRGHDKWRLPTNSMGDVPRFDG